MLAPSGLPAQTGTVEAVLREFASDLEAFAPNLLSALTFLVIAYAIIRAVRWTLRRTLARAYAVDEQLVVDLIVTLVSLVLWFGTLLSLLKILGMGAVAASLGTASGFIALGVAYALKEMIADTVAGVYLLRDPDFNIGDVVTTASVTGTITAIDLRKTRIRTEDGDLVVVANGDVEQKWVREAVSTQRHDADEGSPAEG